MDLRPPAIFAFDIQDIGPALPWIGLGLALVGLYFSLKACRLRRLIDNLPTSKTQGVFIGLVELKGTAQCEQPLTSYLAETSCVYYAYDVQERWSRMVTTTESDGKGGTRTVTRQESGWTTVASETQMTPFYVQDDTGSLLVHPDGARIEALEVFNRTCTPFDELYYAKGPAMGVMDSDHVRRFSEKAIPLLAPFFIIGQARERQDVVAPEIAADPQASDFLISVRTEEEISRGYGWQFGLCFLLGLIMAPGGHLFSELALDDPITPTAYLIHLVEALVFLAVWTTGWIITVYNSLVELRQRVEQGWGQVEIQLKRRHDLIPNLVDVVKGYQAHEAKTQESVATMRRQLSATPPGETGEDFRAVQGQINLLKEAYPELKANQNFLALQKSLSDTEQRIALARSYFNSIATFYNTRLEVIPDRFLAALGAMKPRALMEANDFERAPVQVDFATPAPAAVPPAPLPSS